MVRARNTMFGAVLISPTYARLQILKSVALETNQLLLARILEEYPQGIGLLKLLNLVEPEVVLLDLDESDAALRCAGEIRNHSPRTAVLGFSERLPEFEAAGSDVIHALLPFPPAPEALAASVNESVRRSLFRVKENLLVFLPAKAGSGATTVVRNAAAALAETPGKRVLIIEGDYRSGVLSFLFNDAAEGSVQELLKTAGELDGLRLQKAVVEQNGVFALLSDRTSPDPAPGWEACARLVDVAASRFDPVLADLPETVPPEMRELLRRAGRIFLVSTPDVVALKLAERAHAELLRSGIPDERIGVVLNRWEEGDLAPRHIEQFLRRPVAHVLPHDSRSVRTAVLRREPVRAESELGKSLRAFATKLAAPAQPGPESLGGKLRNMLHWEVRR